MSEILKLENMEEFREWLKNNCLSNNGIWLIFSKERAAKKLTANEALEEALCFGWIDGQMERINETTYKKYFCLRRVNSNWSEKNKKLAESLEEQGLMTNFGRKKIAEAKSNGQWHRVKNNEIAQAQMNEVTELLKKYEPAYTNFLAMTPSVKKTYTRAYLEAKTELGREKRLSWMVERLNKNLKPM